MKRIFRDIRHTLGSYASSDCEMQLMDTLEALDQLEQDFVTLFREVAKTVYHHNQEPSSQFCGLADRLGIPLE